MLFQIFKLNFSCNMYRMHYFSDNFQNSPSAGGFAHQRRLTFYIDYLEFRDLAK